MLKVVADIFSFFKKRAEPNWMARSTRAMTNLDLDFLP
jgi:hypothetical protein